LIEYLTFILRNIKRNNFSYKKEEFLYARNERIRADKLLVIDEQGNSLGVLNKFDALKIARDRELDLIEVSPKANPPVVKIESWSKFKYKLNKKKKETKSKRIEQKEMWFKAFIDKGDLDHKLKRVREFLAEKNPVKLTIKARGRVKTELLKELMQKILKDLEFEIEVPEAPAKFEGHNLSLIVRPIKHKKLKETNHEENKEQNTQSNSKKVPDHQEQKNQA